MVHSRTFTTSTVLIIKWVLVRVCLCVSCIEGIDGPICDVSPLPHFFMPNESHILVVMLLMWPFLS